MERPRMTFTLDFEEHERLTKVAKKLRMTKARLIRNLLRASMDELLMLDNLKITDVLGSYRKIMDRRSDKRIVERAGERR